MASRLRASGRSGDPLNVRPDMQPPPPELAQSMPQVLESHFDMVERAVLALPFATALGAALAFRPRRRGTPPRSAPVIETQIVPRGRRRHRDARRRLEPGARVRHRGRRQPHSIPRED